MSGEHKPNIIFLRVVDNTSKMTRICTVVQQHFNQKQSMLILAPSQEAAEYMDKLLWRMPEHSFLPHTHSNHPSDALILITTAANNLNKASVLFNLCPGVSPISAQFETVYELLDETHPDKLRQSQLRQKHWGQA